MKNLLAWGKVKIGTQNARRKDTTYYFEILILILEIETRLLIWITERLWNITLRPVCCRKCSPG